MSMSSQTPSQHNASVPHAIVVHFMDITDGFNPAELRSPIVTVGKKQLQEVLEEAEQFTANGEFCRCADADALMESEHGQDALYLCFRKVTKMEDAATAVNHTWTMDEIHATLNPDSPNLASEQRHSLIPKVLANMSDIFSIGWKLVLVALALFTVVSVSDAVQARQNQQLQQELNAKVHAGEILSKEAGVWDAALAGDLRVLIVKYQYPDGTAAAENFYGRYAEGSTYMVKSPDIYGQQPDQELVTGSIGDDDLSITVTYNPVKDSRLADPYYSGNAPIGGGMNIEDIPIYQNP